MSNRETFYYKEVLKKERLNTEFGNLELAVWKTLVDQGVHGILYGGSVVASNTETKITVQPFIAVDWNGRHMELDVATDFDFSTDYAGTPTIPSSGHFRWVTAVLRYAKEGSSPVTDGDSATVYTVQTEGFASTGDVTVDSGAGNFGKIRFIAGTEAGSSATANRPSVPSPDIVLCDLLLDDTGLVHLHPQGGISQSEVSVGPIVRHAIGASNFNWDTTKYILLEEFNLFDDGIMIRKYAHRDQDFDPTLVFTINAWWDPLAKLWNADVPTSAALLADLSGSGFRLNTQNRAATTWADIRHDPTGWDGRTSLLANVANGDVSIDGGGTIIGTGAQTAYASFGFVSDAARTGMAVGCTWPQQMAAAPSSYTATPVSGGSPDAHASVGSVTGNQFGADMFIDVATASTSCYIGRKIVGTP